MFTKKIDLVSIGDITTDAFIRLKDASIHCRLDKQNCELCMPFKEKIPFESVKVIRAVGNASNAAVSASRLGLKSLLVSDIGNDDNGKECLDELQRNKIVSRFVTKHYDKATNYHFVLWYENDRTILVNHVDYDYKLPSLPQSKWIYLTSIGAYSPQYYASIQNHLEKNPSIKLAFQPGTFQIKLGLDKMKFFYERSEVFISNLEEAQRILVNDSRDIKYLLKGIHSKGPKLTIITDGVNGAYMFDGDHFYKMPMYPNPRPAVERTGCGDAFASTFVTYLALGMTPLESLIRAPINSMSVSQFIGSQEGLLEHEQVEWWLKKAPDDYRPQEI